MYDFFYWTYVVRGVSCRAVSVCTIFLYRVVLLRGSFRIVVPTSLLAMGLAMGYGGSLAGNTKMRKAILSRVHCKKLRSAIGATVVHLSTQTTNYAGLSDLFPKLFKSGGVF